MNKIIVIFMIFLTVILIGCTEYRTTPEIDSCEIYCKQKGFNLGNCFDCVYLDNVDLPTECSSDKFFFDKNTNLLCGTQLKDNTQHGCLCE